MPEAKLKIKNIKVKTVAKTTKLVVKKAVVKPVVKKALPVKKATQVKKTESKKSVKQLPKETSLRLSVYDTKGQVTETVTLPKEIFDAKVNKPLVAQAVRVYLANKRRGTVKTKSRGEVAISTRKIYRQKGTGRARHGAASAPIFVGGGVAFGPRQRDYSLKLSQKMKKAALFSALTGKLKLGEVKIVKGLEKLEPKTKLMADSVNSLGLIRKNTSILLVTPKAVNDYEAVIKSARNIKGLGIMSANMLNTLEVLKYKNILFMKESLDSLVETFIKEK
jgi:large subunit ribosomal protein L4